MYCDSYCQHPTCWSNIQTQLKQKTLKHDLEGTFEQRFNENRRLYRQYEQSDVKPLNVKNVFNDLDDLLPYEKRRQIRSSPKVESIPKKSLNHQIDILPTIVCGSSVSTFQFFSQPLAESNAKSILKHDPYNLQKCMMWIPKEKKSNDYKTTHVVDRHKKVAEVDLSRKEILDAIYAQTQSHKQRKFSTLPPTGGQPYRNSNMLQRIETKKITDETMAAILGVPLESLKYMMLFENAYEKKTLVKTNNFEDVINTFERLNINNTQVIILHNNSSAITQSLPSLPDNGLTRKHHPSTRSAYECTIDEEQQSNQNDKKDNFKLKRDESPKFKTIPPPPKTTPALTQISLDLPELPNYGVKVTKAFTYTKNNFMNLALEPVLMQTSTPNNMNRIASSMRSKKATVSTNSVAPLLSTTSTTPYNLDYDFYISSNVMLKSEQEEQLLVPNKDKDSSESNDNKVIIQMNLNEPTTDSNSNLNIPPNPTPEPTNRSQVKDENYEKENDDLKSKKFEGLTVEVLKEIGEYYPDTSTNSSEESKDKSNLNSESSEQQQQQMNKDLIRVDYLSPIMEKE